jgi:hypothetical protein
VKKALMVALPMLFALLSITAGWYFLADKQQRHLLSYWWQDWQRSVERPTESYTLFIGSSSISRLPESMLNDCKPLAIYGFNNGTTENIRAYLANTSLQNVARVVLYIGENDIAIGEPPMDTAQQVIDLVSDIKTKTEAPIALVKLKYSPAREKFHSGFLRFNEAIDKHYMGLSQVSLLPFDKLTQQSLYVSDGIHLNMLGYAGFTHLIGSFCRRTN